MYKLQFFTFILNNKLLRILQNKPYNYPSNELFTAYKTLSIPDLHIQQILLLVHKFVHHKYRLPITFVDYFDFIEIFMAIMITLVALMTCMLFR